MSLTILSVWTNAALHKSRTFKWNSLQTSSFKAQKQGPSPNTSELLSLPNTSTYWWSRMCLLPYWGSFCSHFGLVNSNICRKGATFHAKKNKQTNKRNQQPSVLLNIHLRKNMQEKFAVLPLMVSILWKWNNQMNRIPLQSTMYLYVFCELMCSLEMLSRQRETSSYLTA